MKVFLRVVRPSSGTRLLTRVQDVQAAVKYLKTVRNFEKVVVVSLSLFPFSLSVSLSVWMVGS